MKIVEYHEKDRNQVISLWKDCNILAVQNDPDKDIDRKLKGNPELFLVGKIKGKIIATVMGGYEGHRGWINYLAVDPAFQKMGYGKAIMNEIEKRLLALGCPKINLQVRESNESVIQFYQSIGFCNDHVISLGKRLIIDQDPSCK